MAADYVAPRAELVSAAMEDVAAFMARDDVRSRTPGGSSRTCVTAQLAIDRLVEDGVLVQIGRGTRDRVWQAIEVIEAMERFAERARHRMF
jgi:murein endopeptidase